jgi:hypothetical protein
MFFEVGNKLYDAQFSYEVRRRFYDLETFKCRTAEVSKTLAGQNISARENSDDEKYVVTTCTISLVTSPNRGKDRFQKVGEGKATQSRFDPFNKCLGRQIAFGRALLQAIATPSGQATSPDIKRRRLEAWDQYFRQIGDEDKRNLLRKGTRKKEVSKI